MNSIMEAPEHQSTIMSTDGVTKHPHPEQRRGSTPALMVGIGGHKKLCRVAHGQRVVLGTTPPVFVAELRPSASSELLTSSQTPPKSRSPLNVEVDETPLSNNLVNVKLLEAQDSDPCYTSGSEHSALSRNTSEASETLSQECAYSPTLTTTTASTATADMFANSRSPGSAVASSASYEFGSDFSKLTLQDSGYSGSFPLCATNSDASMAVGAATQPAGFDGINPEYYASLLDFTLKLGYSETQLRSVLCKLATTNPGQDKVLAELIKLGQDVQEMPVTAEAVGGAAPQHVPSTPAFGSGTQQQWNQTSGLRSIVIDGSNVAMTHGNKVVFSCLGIRICVDWFRRRGHTDIKVFVPQFRKEQSRSDNPITDQHILFDLEKESVLVWTPSRRLGGRRIICHDDRYILKTAVDKEAIIVSNDEYRDMVHENPDFRKAVEERLLMYNFIDEKFVVPDDPLGRYGPRLDQLLSKSSPNSSAPPCPYGRKCTYGNKCKFYHPERPGGLHRSVTERLRDHAEMHRRISPTNSLQHGRLGATDSYGDLSSFASKGDHVGQKPMAFRTQSLNPATLLRQTSNSSTSPGRYSPPSLSPPYHNHFIVQQPVDQRKYQLQQPHDARVQRLQADGGHTGLSKQMSNPEAARNHCFPTQGAAPRPDDSRYLLMPPAPTQPNSFLRQIWQSEHQSQHHGVSENHLHPHQPVVRNMSAPGVNLLRHQTQLSYAPPPNHPMYVGNHFVNDQQRKNSVSDSQLNLLGVGVGLTTAVDTDDAFYPLSPPFGGSNYFIPSTTVWGPVEHSSSPVFTSPSTTGWTASSASSPPVAHVATGKSSTTSPTAAHRFEATRSKVYYHLSQLFPEELVSWVMRVNPSETDPQKLCSLILATREQRQSGDDNEKKFAE